MNNFIYEVDIDQRIDVNMNDGITGETEYPHNSSINEIFEAIEDYFDSRKWN